MTCERLTIIVICSLLSSLTSYSSNATELMMPNSRSVTGIASMSDRWMEHQDSTTSNYSKVNCCQINSLGLVQSADTMSLKQKGIWTGAAPQRTSSNSSSDTESLPTINRRLFIIAMALTSTVSLFLVWILFKKPVQEPETLAVLPGNQQSENNQKIRVENELTKDKSILPTSSVSEFSQNRVLARQKPTLERHKSTAASLALGKIVITKKNSQTVNIDLVSELIRDLQPNAQFQNLANSSRPSLSKQAQRNLRRKAIWELAKVGDHRSLEPLAKVMSQANSVDKSLISQAITQITNRSFKPINDKLFVLLEDKNPEVRKIAIQDLATLYKFALPITKRLVQMQSDPDNEVRKTATEALKQLRFNSVSPSSDDSRNRIDSSVTDKRDQANIRLVSNLLEKNELDLDR